MFFWLFLMYIRRINLTFLIYVREIYVRNKLYFLNGGNHMAKLVEFVPNFSEGRDKAKVEKIVDEARKIKDLKILDYSSDADHNRSVVTLIGSPEAVTEAAINMAKVAIELIDMRTHEGAHPRFGAVDVVPFTPISEVTMEECVEIANKVGKAYGEMGIPVYLYEDACTKEDRRNLASVRKGQYEGFFDKIKDPNWVPDYGPAEMNEKSGCSAVGARVSLVALPRKFVISAAVYAMSKLWA